MYVHDDSETQCDEFVLAASATRPGQESVVRDLDMEDWSTEIKVTISIWLKNDEKPVHMVGKVFHVVWNGQHLLALADLCYHDPHSDLMMGSCSTPGKASQMGSWCESVISLRNYQFRQDDLREGCVLFRHRGADSAHFVLLVTDGVHHTSFLLEVSASDS